MSVMYTDDFVALVRKYANPASQIQFLKTRFGPADVVTILDYSYPRRSAPCVTGHAGFDWYTSSSICNFTVPQQTEHGTEGRWKEEIRSPEGDMTPAHWDERPTTGYIEVLKRLLAEGVIVPSKTLDRMFNADSGKLVSPTYLRLLYAQ